MVIANTDLKIIASERLTDYDDGGGMMSPNEVVDGEVNNLFPDISDLDRVYGRVSLRKAFLTVRSAVDEMYYGAHCVITDPPDDEAVSVTIFSTGSYADERAAARDRIESYLAVSTEARWRLFGSHLEGQRALLLYSEVGVAAPTIGSTMVLREMTTADDNTATLDHEQYVRIASVLDRETREFWISDTASYKKDVITCEISAPLRADFASTPPDRFSYSPGLTKVHNTSVADAAKYYGVARLADDVAAGAMAVSIESIYAQLVPAAQAEVPQVDVSATGSRRMVVPTGIADALDVACGGFTGQTTKMVYLPCALVPGTVRIGNAVVAADVDDGAGTFSAGGITGSIDYESGQIAITATTTGGTIRVVAQPGVAVSQAGQTSQFPVTAVTRGYNYVFNLQPAPAPGSVYVDYMAQGEWIRLEDDGTGHLVGAQTGQGTGTIDYTTGSVIVTCGALPDVGTAVIYGWGTRQQFEIESPTLETVAVFYLANVGIDPASLTLIVPLAGGDVELTAAADGTLAGTGITGTIDYSTGRVELTMSSIQASTTSLTAAYTHGTQGDWTDAFSAAVDLGVANITPGSLEISYWVQGASPSYYGQASYTVSKHRTATDDGLGNLVRDDGTTVGTVAYGAGTFAITADETTPMPFPTLYPPEIVASGVSLHSV